MSKEDGCKKNCFAKKTFEVLQPSVLFFFFLTKIYFKPLICDIIN